MNYIIFGYLTAGVIMFSVSVAIGLISQYLKEDGLLVTVGVILQLVFLWPKTIIESISLILKRNKS